MALHLCGQLFHPVSIDGCTGEEQIKKRSDHSRFSAAQHQPASVSENVPPPTAGAWPEKRLDKRKRSGYIFQRINVVGREGKKTKLDLNNI